MSLNCLNLTPEERGLSRFAFVLLLFHVLVIQGVRELQ